MNRTLVVVFLAMIALPLAATVAGIDGGDPDAENRELAPFPHWDGTWKSMAEYPDGFSRWFEDHFAGRAHLVRWSGEIHLFGLGVSPADTVIAGRDGWLYYADDGGVDDYANATPLTEGEVRAWHQAIVRTDDWLRRRNIAYLFTIAPDKHAIYPEHVPEGVRRVHGESRMDQVLKTLAGTRINLVDVRPALEREKVQERIYYLTDTHWNDRGAFIAYQQIIDALRRQAPAVPPAWTRDEFSPIEREIEGKDLAGMLGLKHVLHEEELSLAPKRPRMARVVDPPGAGPLAEVGRLVTEIPNSRLPRAVIFRDSFATRLAPFLSEHFSRAVYLWQNDFDADVVLAEHPDVVIEEITSRHLYTFVPTPELIPQ